jgi:hypothetical protein
MPTLINKLKLEYNNNFYDVWVKSDNVYLESTNFKLSKFLRNYILFMNNKNVIKVELNKNYFDIKPKIFHTKQYKQYFKNHNNIFIREAKNLNLNKSKFLKINNQLLDKLYSKIKLGTLCCDKYIFINIIDEFI